MYCVKFVPRRLAREAHALDEKDPQAFRTISEVAVELDLPQHVLRFWESRFRDIKPMKRGGGRRYYRPDDILLLRGIRHLLYGEGYTIRGVQRILREQGVKFVQAVWEEGAPQPPHGVSEDEILNEEAESAAEMLEEESGLRGKLTSLIGRDFGDRAAPIDARQEPPLQSAPMPRIEPEDRFAHVAPPAPRAEAPAPPSASPAGLARDDVRKLRAVLHELSECRKLVDAALARPD
jgi:DNA-binding transcriptional MerR regulator